MKFLAWDTSQRTGLIVAAEAGRKGPVVGLEATVLDTLSTHSEGLLWGIHQMLGLKGWALSDVDVFGVGVGPGSFTGLRIGVTTARTIAHLLKRRIVPVSSLAMRVRHRAVQSNPRAAIWISENAFGGEAYVLSGPAGDVARVVSVPEKGFKGLWRPKVREEVVADEVAGRAFPITAESDPVCGESLMDLVIEGWRAGAVMKALQVKPRYLRGSSAQIKLEKGLLKS